MFWVRTMFCSTSHFRLDVTDSWSYVCWGFSAIWPLALCVLATHFSLFPVHFLPHRPFSWSLIICLLHALACLVILCTSLTLTLFASRTLLTGSRMQTGFGRSLIFTSEETPSSTSTSKKKCSASPRRKRSNLKPNLKRLDAEEAEAEAWPTETEKAKADAEVAEVAVEEPVEAAEAEAEAAEINVEEVVADEAEDKQWTDVREINFSSPFKYIHLLLFPDRSNKTKSCDSTRSAFPTASFQTPNLFSSSWTTEDPDTSYS